MASRAARRTHPGGGVSWYGSSRFHAAGEVSLTQARTAYFAGLFSLS